jgi:hypothetical protein
MRRFAWLARKTFRLECSGIEGRKLVGCLEVERRRLSRPLR